MLYSCFVIEFANEMEIDIIRTLKAKLDEMFEKELITKSGEKKGTKYFINIFA